MPIHDKQHLMASLAGGMVGFGLFLIYQYGYRMPSIVQAILWTSTGSAFACMLSLATRNNMIGGRPNDKSHTEQVKNK